MISIELKIGYAIEHVHSDHSGYENGDGCEFGIGDGCGNAYINKSGNGNGSGFGDGSGYEDRHGIGYGRGHGSCELIKKLNKELNV